MQNTNRPSASQPLRLAFLGTPPPRTCGIATFARDSGEAVPGVRDDVSTRVLAVTDSSGTMDWTEERSVSASVPAHQLGGTR